MILHQAIDQKDVQRYIFDMLNSCPFVGLRQWSKLLPIFTYVSRVYMQAYTQACSMLIIGWLHWWQVHKPTLINSGKHHPSKTTHHGIHIFIILRLVPMRLDGSLVKYLRGYVTTPPTCPLTTGLDTSLLGTDEAKAIKLFKKMKTGVHMTGYWQDESHPLHWSNTAGHRQGEGGTSVRVDEDRRTHDWAPTRPKSSSSSTHHVYIRHGDGVVMIGFQQCKGHPHAFHLPTHEQHSTRRHDDHCA
jgi:hypothetical protein